MPIMRKIEQLLERLENAEPVISYRVDISTASRREDEYGQVDTWGDVGVFTQTAFESFKPEKHYPFTVHGYNCVLGSDSLEIGCQNKTLNEWDNEIEDEVDQEFGYQDKISTLILAQWKEALPVFKRLQAKLNGRAVKKTTKRKKKAGR